MVAAHVLLVWALLTQMPALRRAVAPFAPLMVSLVDAGPAEAAPADRLPQRARPASPRLLPPPPVPLPAPIVAPAPAVPEPTAPEAAREAAPTAPGAPADAAVPATPAAPGPAHAAPAPPTPPRVLPASAVRFIEPPQVTYPRLSRRLRESGRAVVRVSLSAEGGAPQALQIAQSSGFARLDEAALAAVSRARFKPYVEDGRAQRCTVLVPIDFELDS